MTTTTDRHDLNISAGDRVLYHPDDETAIAAVIIEVDDTTGRCTIMPDRVGETFDVDGSQLDQIIDEIDDDDDTGPTMTQVGRGVFMVCSVCGEIVEHGYDGDQDGKNYCGQPCNPTMASGADHMSTTSGDTRTPVPVVPFTRPMTVGAFAFHLICTTKMLLPGRPVVAAIHAFDTDSVPAGIIKWLVGDQDDAELLIVAVRTDFRRQGLATALWRAANDVAKIEKWPSPAMTADRTDAGDEWARSLGIELPDRKAIDPVRGWD